MGRCLWSSRRWWMRTIWCSTRRWRTRGTGMSTTRSPTPRWIEWRTFSFCPTSTRIIGSSSLCQWNPLTSRAGWGRITFYGMQTKWSMCSRRSSPRQRSSRTAGFSKGPERPQYSSSSATTATSTTSSSTCQCSSKCCYISNAMDTPAYKAEGSRRRRPTRRPL